MLSQVASSTSLSLSLQAFGVALPGIRHQSPRLLANTLTIMPMSQYSHSPISCGCRIHRLHLCRGVRTDPPPNECHGYDTKQSGGEAPVILELWGMWSTLSLPLLPSPFWPRVVAPENVFTNYRYLICMSKHLVLNNQTKPIAHINNPQPDSVINWILIWNFHYIMFNLCD